VAATRIAIAPVARRINMSFPLFRYGIAQTLRRIDARRSEGTPGYASSPPQPRSAHRFSRVRLYGNHRQAAFPIPTGSLVSRPCGRLYSRRRSALVGSSRAHAAALISLTTLAIHDQRVNIDKLGPKPAQYPVGRISRAFSDGAETLRCADGLRSGP